MLPPPLTEMKVSDPMFFLYFSLLHISHHTQPLQSDQFLYNSNSINYKINIVSPTTGNTREETKTTHIQVEYSAAAVAACTGSSSSSGKPTTAAADAYQKDNLN